MQSNSQLNELLYTIVNSGINILDLRSKQNFEMCRVKGSTHFEFKLLNENLFSSLPPSSCQGLILCGVETEVKEAEQILSMKNWKIPIKLIVEDHSVIFRIKEFQKYFEKGPGRGPRLWKPNIVLLEQIESIEQMILQDIKPTKKLKNNNQSEIIISNQLKALDFGCGRGRDVIYLAERNWKVCGIDNLQQNIEATINWAKIANLQQNVELINLDLNKCDYLKLCQVIENKQLYIFSRYLNFKILQLTKQIMDIGSYIIIHHFVEGQSQSRNGKKFKKQDLIEQQQLLLQFKDFEIIFDKFVLDESQTRSLTYFLAKKIQL